MALSKAEGPFDKLTVLSKVEGLIAPSKAEGRRCDSFLVTAVYWEVRLIPKNSRALHLGLFAVPARF